MVHRRAKNERLLNHIVLAGLTIFAYALTKRYSPYAAPPYLLTIGMGYESLLLIGVSLVIGPLLLFTRRRNPVNLMLRRDVGIWAGVTGLVHVIFGLTLNSRGDILSNFLRWTPESYRIMTNRRAISNDIGLLATVILLLLLLTSNNLMLRRLKGKRWKMLQRLNYLLVVLALIHTFIYQTAGSREPAFQNATILGMILLIAIQLGGVMLYQRHPQRPHHRWHSAAPRRHFAEE